MSPIWRHHESGKIITKGGSVCISEDYPCHPFKDFLDEYAANSGVHVQTSWTGQQPNETHREARLNYKFDQSEGSPTFTLSRVAAGACVDQWEMDEESFVFQYRITYDDDTKGIWFHYNSTEYRLWLYLFTAPVAGVFFGDEMDAGDSRWMLGYLSGGSATAWKGAIDGGPTGTFSSIDPNFPVASVVVS